MINEYPTKIARIGTILALISTMIWVQWPIDIDRFGIAPSITMVGALITWISVELADWQNHSSYNVNILNEDAEKMNSLIQIVDRKTYYILRNAAVETYIGSDDYRGLEDLVAHKIQDPFKFHNEKVQKSYESFVRKSDKFLHSLWTLYTNNGHGMATWRPRGEDSQWVDDTTYQKVISKVAKLNRMTTELADDWESFIQIAKSELRGNSVGIVAYRPVN